MVVLAAAIVLQRGPFGGAQARIGKEIVGALLVGVCDQRAVELLRHIHGRLAFPGMQDRKGVVAQRPVSGSGDNHGRLFAGEKTTTGGKWRCVALLGILGRGRRLGNSIGRTRMLVHGGTEFLDELFELGASSRQFAP